MAGRWIFFAIPLPSDEEVLATAQGRENIHGVPVCKIRPQPRRQRRVISPQEGIGPLFIAQQGRNGGKAARQQAVHLPDARQQGGIIGVDAEGKSGVGTGIFMRAENARAVRQFPQPAQAVPHLVRGAFKQPSTPQ